MGHSSQSGTNTLNPNVSTQESAFDVEATWPAARWCEKALSVSTAKSSRAQCSLFASLCGSCDF